MNNWGVEGTGQIFIHLVSQLFCFLSSYLGPVTVIEAQDSV
jgi:hypothetical protein